MFRFNTLDWIAFVLVFIGGLNWGLVGFFDFNLATVFFDEVSVIIRIIYAVIGVSALYLLVSVVSKSSQK